MFAFQHSIFVIHIVIREHKYVFSSDLLVDLNYFYSPEI